MRAQRGFTLIEIMIVIVLLGIVAALSIAGFKKWVGDSNDVVIEQQAKHYQDTLNAWVSNSTSLGAAAKDFQSTGGVMTPKDPAALLAKLNLLIVTDVDHASVGADGHISTEKMRALGAYMEITWPLPYRDNYPRINLIKTETP